MKYNKQIIKEEIEKMVRAEGIFDAPAAIWGGIKGAGQNIVGNYRSNAVKTRMDRAANEIEKTFSKAAGEAEKTGQKMSASPNPSVKATGENIIQQTDAAKENIEQAVGHLKQAFPSSVGQVMQPATKQNPQPQINLVQPQQIQQAQQQAVQKAAQPVAPQIKPGQAAPAAPQVAPKMRPGAKAQSPVIQHAPPGNATNQPAPQQKVAKQPPQQVSRFQKNLAKLGPDEQKLITDYIKSAKPSAIASIEAMEKNRLQKLAAALLARETAAKPQSQTESKIFKLADIF